MALFLVKDCCQFYYCISPVLSQFSRIKLSLIQRSILDREMNPGMMLLEFEADLIFLGVVLWFAVCF